MTSQNDSVESRVGQERLPMLRLVTVLPYPLVFVHALLSAEEVRLVALLPYLLLGGLLVVLGLVTETGAVQFGWLDRDRWVLLSVFGGTALLVPVLGSVLDVNVLAFNAAIGLMLLNMAVMLRRRIRFLAAGWVIVVWGVTLWSSGVRGEELLGTVVAALVVFGVGVAVADQLLRAAEREREARLQAESSAQLLESLLGLRSLDVAGVASAAAEAVRHQGYPGAAVRVLDDRRREARCLAAVGDVDPAPRSLSGQTLATLIVAGQPATVAGLDGNPVHYQPLRERGETVWVLEVRPAASAGDPAGSQAVAAIVRRAESALARARAFERDRHDIRELALLEHRTRDLVSTVSHELRTPMTVISGLGETLGGRWHDLPAEVRSTLLGRIGANADRLDAIIGSLIDSGALEHGQVRPAPREVALAPLVAEVVDRLSLVTAAHRVRTDIPDELRVVVDPALFEHVLENLLINVVHHTPPGSEAVVAGGQAAGVGVMLTVTDDGPGITDTEVEHVFERFFRGGDPDRRSSGGLGLGLALARQIVRAHGGELSVARVGATGGTRFTVSLPVADAGRAGPGEG